ncbi:MAG: NYN domain-containing protein [Desulfovibrio sp.]|nr:NYN domain-containing protein [Desulfovibrio sp.]
MKKVAVFVDGNYLFNQLKYFKSFFLNGPKLLKYCLRHLRQGEEIYRIFYYDAPPLETVAQNPLGETIDFSKTTAAISMKARLESLRETPLIALRLGRVSWYNEWVLRPATLKQLLDGKKALSKLTSTDFVPNVKQKAVDMKIGLDIASLAFKKLVSRIVIIAGDSDFAPATKTARVEGLQVTVDSVGGKVSSELIKHVDWVYCPLDPQNSDDVPKNKNNFWVSAKTFPSVQS